jgi:hypothetical protein
MTANGAGRAVVLREHDLFCLGIVGLEVGEDARVGAAPRVDGLVGVAGDAQVPAFLGQQAGELVLVPVDVLELVHEDVGEPPAPGVEGAAAVLEHPHGLDEQVVEVERVRFLEDLLVALAGADEVVLERLPDPALPRDLDLGAAVALGGDVLEQRPGRGEVVGQS